jgi:Icc-related predicted phosphoesterase
MRILAIGDFHGRFPSKLFNLAKSRDIDLILVTGDFAGISKIRRLIFKNWAGKKWYETIGLKAAAKLEKEGFDSGLKILIKLNKIRRRIPIIWGNSDFYEDDLVEPEEILPGNYADFLKMMKNLYLVDRKMKKFAGLEVVGHGGYVDVTDFITHPVDKDKNKQKKRLSRYKKQGRELFNIFKKYKPKDFIFLIHYTPLNCLDKVRFKGSPMNGKHVGFEPYNKVIKKYKPFLAICGHMHENQGKCKIGETLVVNAGSAREGKAAIIEIDEKKRKVLNVKFLR